jgi:hypothetical protein
LCFNSPWHIKGRGEIAENKKRLKMSFDWVIILPGSRPKVMAVLNVLKIQPKAICSYISRAFMHSTMD